MHSRKSLGQHYLPPHQQQRLVAAAGIGPEDCVLEIGSGPTHLTRALLEREARVVAVEVDPYFVPAGEELERENPRFTFVPGDILDLDLRLLLPGAGSRAWKVVANIPYYITTPILEKLLEQNAGLFSDLYLLMQAEVAERITATGERHGGALTLFVRYWADPRILLRVPGRDFSPPAQVDSSLLHLAIREGPPVTGDRRDLFRVVRAAFAQRRKMLRNSLQGLYETTALAQAFEAAGIPGTRRPETLTLEEFARLAQSLKLSATASGQPEPPM